MPPAAATLGARRPPTPLTVQDRHVLSRRRRCRPARRSCVGLFTAEPLVAVAWDGRPVYRLAESVTESEDRRELTVKLRRDVRFHTGDADHALAVVARPADAQAERSSAGDRVDRGDRTITAASSRLHKPSTVQPEDLEHADRRQQRRARPALAHRPVQGDVDRAAGARAVRRVLPGTAGRAAGRDQEYPNHRAAWTGDDARRGQLPPRGQPRRDRVRRGGRRHPRLPAAAAVLHRARLQHAASGAARREVRRRDQRGHRSRRAGARTACAATARSPRARSGRITGPTRRAGSRSRSTRRRRRLRLDGVGLEVRPAGAASRCRPGSRSRAWSWPDDARFERIALLVQRQLYAVGIDMQLEPLPLKELAPRLSGRGLRRLHPRDGERPHPRAGPTDFWHSPPPTRSRIPAPGTSAPTPRSIGCRSRVPTTRCARRSLDVMHGDARRSAGGVPGLAARGARRRRLDSKCPTSPTATSSARSGR